MTGGEDVHPKFYKKTEYIEEYGLTDFDEKRDEFEMELLSRWERIRKTTAWRLSRPSAF
jgi:putative glutamine amidotransferase